MYRALCRLPRGKGKGRLWHDRHGKRRGYICGKGLSMDSGPLERGAHPGFKAMTDRIHQYGTVVIAQLNHPGRQASEKFAKAQSWAPSAIPDPYHNREMPHEMTIEEIHKTVADFGDAARRGEGSGL